MKPTKLLFALCIHMAFIAQSQTFTYSPIHPKAGENVNFIYDKSKTVLSSKSEIEFTVYFLNWIDNKNSVISITPSQNGNIYKGSFLIPKNATTIAFNAFEGETKDNNKGKGYLIPVSDQNGEMVAGSNYATSIIYNGFGQAYLGLETNPDIALNYLQKDWDNHTSLRTKMMGQYFNLLNRTKKKDAEPIILQNLNALAATENLNENDYSIISFYYNRLKQVEKTTSIQKQLKEKFPEGNWKKNEARIAFNAIADFEKRFEAINQFIALNPSKDDETKFANNRMYSSLATAYGNNKKKVDIDILEKYTALLEPANKASIYNNLAWTWAYTKDTMYSQSEQLSKYTVDWAKSELDNPKGPKPDLLTENMWLKERKYSYAMYTDTYSNALYKLKDYAGSLKYARIGCEMNKWNQPDYNDRYAQSAEKVLTNGQLIKDLSPMVEKNVAGKITKEVLKRAFIIEFNSEIEADKKITALIEAGNKKAKEDLAKKLMNENAVDFKLTNLDGTDVQLAALKGKVVVVDFWATWCGPCIASFPGMQKTIDKYKNNQDVAFVFINTWENQETQEQRKKEVTEFIKSKKYTFNVLYDTKDDSGEYKVISKYKVDGIPTKFIIGKDGKVKFKSVGGDSNVDKLVSELSAMIDMAGN
ncbi:MAG: redoxin family protein [Sediminibacterium sp.]|nr:redoxin family protein [Sediminibacterium sp.]